MLLTRALIAVALVLAGCEEPEDPLLAELREAVTEDQAAYTDWGQAEGLEGVIVGSDGIHGNWVQVWYNATALDDLDEPAHGAAAFKEMYRDEAGDNLRATVGLRYDADYGWFHAFFNAEGELANSGTIGSCSGCHGGGFLAD